MLIRKIAFVVHEPTMYAHYGSVWREMDKSSFTIVLTGRLCRQNREEVSVKTFLEKVSRCGYEFIYLEDALKKNIRYQYVVSNHILGGKTAHRAPMYERIRNKTKALLKTILNFCLWCAHRKKRFSISLLDRKQYIPLQVGLTQIRFMYGADFSDGWSADTWNDMYDVFMCHGPNDKALMEARFKGKAVMMGYPRYDGYFSPELDVESVKKEFSLDTGKPCLLWMPTADLFRERVCSIPYFVEAVSGLLKDFDLIVRPHPITFFSHPEHISILEEKGLKIDRDATRDMNTLFKVADAILCDHGGSAFGALYLNKKLFLLETPCADDATVVQNSTNLDLLSLFPILKPNDVGDLKVVFDDSEFWKDCLEKGRDLSNKYFLDNQGSGSKRAAEILANIDRIMDE